MIHEGGLDKFVPTKLTLGPALVEKKLFDLPEALEKSEESAQRCSEFPSLSDMNRVDAHKPSKIFDS